MCDLSDLTSSTSVLDILPCLLSQYDLSFLKPVSFLNQTLNTLFWCCFSPKPCAALPCPSANLVTSLQAAKGCPCQCRDPRWTTSDRRTGNGGQGHSHHVQGVLTKGPSILKGADLGGPEGHVVPGGSSIPGIPVTSKILFPSNFPKSLQKILLTSASYMLLRNKNPLLQVLPVSCLMIRFSTTRQWFGSLTRQGHWDLREYTGTENIGRRVEHTFNNWSTSSWQNSSSPTFTSSSNPQPGIPSFSWNINVFQKTNGMILPVGRGLRAAQWDMKNFLVFTPDFWFWWRTFVQGYGSI